jgi:hypothetical protein
VKILPTLLLLLAGSAGVLFAQEESPAPADLLVVPEVSDRPLEAAGGDAGPDPSPVAETGEPPTAVPEETPVAPAEEAGADEIVPAPFPLSRYEDLWKKSPFQLESTAPPVESAGLAQRYALTGIAEISGEPIAFVMERATQQRMMVRKNGGGSSDLSLVQVDVADKKYDESTVTLRQGAEVGVVKFDAGPAMPAPTMASPMAQTGRPPQVQPGRPAMQVPGVPASPPQPQIPGQPGATAAVPGQTAPGVVPPVPGPGIPQNGQVQQPGQPQMPPPRVIRRRAIVPAAP